MIFKSFPNPSYPPHFIYHLIELRFYYNHVFLYILNLTVKPHLHYVFLGSKQSKTLVKSNFMPSPCMYPNMSVLKNTMSTRRELMPINFKVSLVISKGNPGTIPYSTHLEPLTVLSDYLTTSLTLSPPCFPLTCSYDDIISDLLVK